MPTVPQVLRQQPTGPTARVSLYLCPFSKFSFLSSQHLKASQARERTPKSPPAQEGHALWASPACHTPLSASWPPPGLASAPWPVRSPASRLFRGPQGSDPPFPQVRQKALSPPGRALPPPALHPPQRGAPGTPGLVTDSVACL